jgi:hypothetical protein
MTGKSSEGGVAMCMYSGYYRTGCGAFNDMPPFLIAVIKVIVYDFTHGANHELYSVGVNKFFFTIDSRGIAT